ncbi:MAG: restriction endonuclease subunit S [Candidatus Enterosoma sp.]|nr:restriction endonuclease subunit S [Candidatus Enterosoma sp.]
MEYEDIISDDGILNKDVRGKQTGKRGILFEEGDVLYGKLRPYLHNWLKPSFNGVVVGDFWVLQPHENIDVGFLYTLIKSPMFDSVANLSSGSKMPRADWNLVSSSAFSVPSNKEEQHKIGKLFGTLDDSISLHQRKLEKLQAIKKSLLQKMFPAGGEDRPQIRFAGYTDAWGQVKLGEILQEFSEKSVIENQYPLLSSTNTGIEYRDGRVSGEHNVGYKIIDQGDLVFSPQNLWLGNININHLGRGIVSPSYKTMKIVNYEAGFLEPILRSEHMLNQYKLASIQGASVVRRNLDPALFDEIEVPYPGLEEQRKVAAIFEQMESAVALHQRSPFWAQTSPANALMTRSMSLFSSSWMMWR